MMMDSIFRTFGRLSFALLVASVTTGLPVASLLLALDVERSTALTVAGFVVVAVGERLL